MRANGARRLLEIPRHVLYGGVSLLHVIFQAIVTRVFHITAGTGRYWLYDAVSTS